MEVKKKKISDPIRTRGDLLPKYKLSDRDKKKVNNYLKNKKMESSIGVLLILLQAFI